MAAVLGRTIQRGVTCDCGSGQEEVVYFDSPRRGLLHSAFAPFYIVTLAVNTVAVGTGIWSQFDLHFNRHGYGFYWLDGWYFCNALFALLHIAAAFYIVRKIEEPAPTMANYSTHHQMVSARLESAVPPPPQPQQPYVKSIVTRNVVQRDPLYNPSIYDNRASAPPQTQYNLAVPNYNPSQPAGLPNYVPDEIVHNWEPPTEPESWARIRHVLCQSKVFAVYILVFVAYVLWHTLFDVHKWNHTLHFVMRCADIFIIAGPASFVFSVMLLLCKRRELY